MEYEFTLKFKLAPHDADHDAIVEQLGEAGCTDALVGLGIPDRLGLEFIREAPSAERAMRSALADVRRALPDATLIEAGPDLVGLTDIAERLGVSRQGVRKLMTANAADFPLPVHCGSLALWHLAPVLRFLSRRRQGLAPADIEIAEAAMRINIEKEAALLGTAPRSRRLAAVA